MRFPSVQKKMSKSRKPKNICPTWSPRHLPRIHNGCPALRPALSTYTYKSQLLSIEKKVKYIRRNTQNFRSISLGLGSFFILPRASFPPQTRSGPRLLSVTDCRGDRNLVPRPAAFSVIPFLFCFVSFRGCWPHTARGLVQRRPAPRVSQSFWLHGRIQIGD